METESLLGHALFLAPRHSDRHEETKRVVAPGEADPRVGRQVVARAAESVRATDEILGRLKDVPHGQILRAMTSEDANELAHIRSNERQEFETCERHVRQLALSMQLIDIEL